MHSLLRWALGATAVVGAISGKAAAPTDVMLGQDVFPESLSSSRAGHLFIGSIKGGVLRVSPAGKASQWIAPGADQTRSVFGVLVAICGCMRGIQSGRSASAVGLAATSAVVTAIVFIIVTDGVFAVLTNALGI